MCAWQAQQLKCWLAKALDMRHGGVAPAVLACGCCADRLMRVRGMLKRGSSSRLHVGAYNMGLT